jgi:hypothetical protein
MQSYMDNIYLKHRNDRMGSNFFMQMGIFIFSKIHNLNLYYKNDNKYINDMYFFPFKNNSKLLTDNNISLIPHNVPKECFITDENKKNPTFMCDGIRGSSVHSVITSKQDTISYFNENLKDDCFKIIKEEANKRNFELPWKDNSNIICIHIRLGDVCKNKDNNAKSGFNQYSKLIEDEKWINYKKAPHDVQCPINSNKLEKLLIEFKEKYPKKEIYLIMNNNSVPKSYMDLIEKYNLHYFTNNNIDYDIWLMINCDILVLTKSTFPIISAYYFQGSQIYYQIWPTIACLGLGTKYNKSNWIGFE